MKKAKIERQGRWFDKNIEALYAPTDFRLLKNPKECADFFTKLLKMENIQHVSDEYSEVQVNLKNVHKIDFASTLMLSYICKELAKKRCNVKEFHNNDDSCYTYLKESGFFDRRYDSKGNLILHAGKSKIMVFEAGIKVMAKNTKKFIEIINQTGIHLTSKSIANMTDYVGMIKEICGNSCEWGGVDKTVSLLCS